MAVSLQECAGILAQESIRHHVDHEEQAIRIAFVTHSYRNLRGEKLAIVRLEAPDDGHRCRVSIERAFPADGDAAAACMTACLLAAATPAVHVEFDAEFENLRMVAETVVEDGTLTPLQMMSMIDRLVEAAEAWHPSMAAACGSGREAA
jgi:hypothetical protein